ncbi:phosphotransferase [Peribacillus butanolivorans]|uniref:phosphotransferase n=1 Tax=Peribacillus butanolivorans TaxID=421767 RepID=UPI0036DE9B09
MKAMTTNYQQGSVFYTRLLSYLNRRPRNIHHLQSSVYLITFEKDPPLILKGFDSFEKWDRQRELTSLLRQKGFTQTYYIHQNLMPFQFEGKWYGSIDYLPPSKKKFRYSNQKDRLEGIQLLESFHDVSEHLYIKAPVFDQAKKWKERLSLFKKNFSYIRQYVSEEIIKEWIGWGEWALDGFEKNQSLWNKEKKVIIHGDCAHHNFLRKADGTLTLIDFDLMASAPRCIDYLQYANRISNHLEDPATMLWQIPQLKKYQSDPAFLYALTYPTDIFREWNRQNKSSSQLHSVWKMTVEDFSERMEMNEKLKEKISSLNRK